MTLQKAHNYLKELIIESNWMFFNDPKPLAGDPHSPSLVDENGVRKRSRDRVFVRVNEGDKYGYRSCLGFQTRSLEAAIRRQNHLNKSPFECQ